MAATQPIESSPSPECLPRLAGKEAKGKAQMAKFNVSVSVRTQADIKVAKRDIKSHIVSLLGKSGVLKNAKGEDVGARISFAGIEEEE